jgi:hypothetical protein
MVVEAFERGWERLVNGELLNEAEAAGFEAVLLTPRVAKGCHGVRNITSACGIL